MSRRKSSTYAEQNKHKIQVLERYKRVHALDSAVHRLIQLKIKFKGQPTENFIEI